MPRYSPISNPSQRRSHWSLYRQSRPYLEIMCNSHRQIEICIAAPFRISKMRVVPRLIPFIVVVIVNKICCKGGYVSARARAQERPELGFSPKTPLPIPHLYIVKRRLENEQRPRTSKTSYSSTFALILPYSFALEPLPPDHFGLQKAIRPRIRPMDREAVRGLCPRGPSFTGCYLTLSGSTSAPGYRP